MSKQAANGSTNNTEWADWLTESLELGELHNLLICEIMINEIIINNYKNNL